MLNVLSALPGFILRLTQEIQCIAKSMTANCSTERPTRHSILELAALDQCDVLIVRRRNTLQTDCFCGLRAIRPCTAPHRKPLPLSSAHFSASPPPIPQRTALSFHSSQKSEKNPGKNVS